LLKNFKFKMDPSKSTSVRDLTAEEKLRLNPEIVASSMMINPEPFNEISPTLPESFPSELIPSNICEKEILNLTECLLKNKYDNVKCEQFQLDFYSCKKSRDTLLVSRIKTWEEIYYSKMNIEDQNFYLQNLRNKKREYVQKYEAIEITLDNRMKRIRLLSDLELLDWRINYLKNMNFSFKDNNSLSEKNNQNFI